MLNLNSGPPSKQLSPAALLIFCMSLSSVVLLGQSTVGTGSVRGAVSDQSGKPITGATVTFINKATAGIVRWTTSPDGNYSSGPLLPGDYTLRVEAKGFKTVEFPLTVQLGIALLANVKLEVGPQHPVVKAAAPAMVLNTEQPTVQAVLPGSQIEDSPINGRNFFDFAEIEPGVQMQDGGNLFPGKTAFSSLSFLGRYGRGGQVDVDGVNISDETGGAITQNIPASAIQEFNLSQSSLDLSTGLSSAGAVSVATRSGADDLHGDLFGLYRTHLTAAALPGAKGIQSQEELPFQQEQYGGRAGGSIIKDKVFWFLDGERTQRNLNAAQPFVAPFNTLGASVVQPYRESLADGRLDWQRQDNAHAFTRLNFDENSQVGPFGSASSLQAVKSESHSPSLTIGYDFNTGPYTHSFRFEYLRFANGVADNTAGLSGANDPFPGLGINIGAPVEGLCALSGGGAYCGGPSPLAPQTNFQSDYEVRYDGSRMMGDHIVRYGALWNRIAAGGISSFYTSPQVGTTSTCLPGGLNAANCVTNGNPTSYPADSVFIGNGLDFVTGKSAFGYSGGGLGPDNRIAAYIGDAWKMSPNFTFSYGLRYSHDSGRVDNDLGPLSVLNEWAPGLGNRVREPANNFAPRIGFAWDPAGTGRTIIRAGAGLYYDNTLFNNLQRDSPGRTAQGTFSYSRQICNFGDSDAFTWPTSLSGLTLNSPIAGGAGIVVNPGASQVAPTFCGDAISKAGAQILALSNAFQAAAHANAGAQPNNNFVGTALNASNVNGVDVFAPTYQTPRSWQVNLGFQHELGSGMFFSADYIRNIGEHYLLGVDQNHSGAARSYNLFNATAARDRAQTNAATLYHGTQNCPAGLGQAQCMIASFGGVPGAQAAYSAAGLDSNSATTGGGPCSFCAFPGITPGGINNNGNGAGNGSLGTLDTLYPVGRSVYSGAQLKLSERLIKPMRGVNAANFQLSYVYSKYVSQSADQDFPTLATDNDAPLLFTGPNGMDRKQQISLRGTLDLPYFLKVTLIGHFFSPLAETLELPELTTGGEIYATDYLGSGLGSGAAPEPVPNTRIGQFMRATDVRDLQNVISIYNSHFAGQLTPAGHCLAGDGSCPGLGPIAVMTQTDLAALGWVMPTLPALPFGAINMPWLKTFDVRAAWPIKIRDRFTVEPSANFFNVLNIATPFQPGNLPLGSMLPGPNPTLVSSGVLAPNVVGGVTGAGLNPFRAGVQPGTFALGAPRQIEFGLRVEF